MNVQPDNDAEECIGCKGKFPKTDGPVHEYMESSPGCWAVFGRVLAKEYSDQQFFDIHRLTVDSYAVQHPGKPSRQSIQSVGVHLIRLCLFLEHGLDPARANEAMLAAAKHKSGYHWLEPPAALGKITIGDIDQATSTNEHKARVKCWAEQMWEVWSLHHDVIRRWAVET